MNTSIRKLANNSNEYIFKERNITESRKRKTGKNLSIGGNPTNMIMQQVRATNKIIGHSSFTDREIVTPQQSKVLVLFLNCFQFRQIRTVKPRQNASQESAEHIKLAAMTPIKNQAVLKSNFTKTGKNTERESEDKSFFHLRSAAQTPSLVQEKKANSTQRKFYNRVLSKQEPGGVFRERINRTTAQTPVRKNKTFEKSSILNENTVNMSQPTGIEEESKVEPLPLVQESERQNKNVRLKQIVAQTPKIHGREFAFTNKIVEDKNITLDNSFISENEISKIQNLTNLIQDNQDSVQDEFFQPDLILEQTSIKSETSSISPKTTLARRKQSSKKGAFHLKAIKEKSKLKFIEIVKEEVQKFLHKNTIANGVSENEMQSIMVRKQQRFDSDGVKYEYLQQLLTLNSLALKAFNQKQKDKSMKLIQDMKNMAQHAYDLEILKYCSFFQGLILNYYAKNKEAVTFFKQARDFANEELNMEDKKKAYKFMAKCYQESQQYKDAVKCYKKVMECAWSQGDFKSEIQAYEGLSVQYYYLGELHVSLYYKDRATRGKIEKKDSQVKKIYLSALNYKLNDQKKNQINLLHLGKAESLLKAKTSQKKKENRAQKLNTSVESLPEQPINYSQVQTSTIQDFTDDYIVTLKGMDKLKDYYQNAFDKDKMPIFVRKGTPISEAGPNDFPSPRMGMDDFLNGIEGTNYELLPCSAVDHSRLGMEKRNQHLYQDSDKPSIWGVNGPLKGVRKYPTVKPLLINQPKPPVYTQGRKLLPVEEEEQFKKYSEKNFDMLEIVKRAKVLAMKKQGEAQSQISLSHLNVASHKKLAKLQLDKKNKEVQAKFQQLDLYLKRQLILVEFEPTHVEDLPPDFAYKLFKDIQQSHQQRSFLNAMSSTGGTSAVMDSKDLGSVVGNVEFSTPYAKLCDPQALKEKNELVSFACVNHPYNFKLKRLNDRIKKAIWTLAQNYKQGVNSVNQSYLQSQSLISSMVLEEVAEV